MASFDDAALLEQRGRTATSRPSDAIATKRCSVLTYSSFSRSASCSAASVTCRNRADSAGCEPPCARGSFCSSARTALASAAGSAFILRTISGTMPSRCSTSVSSRCSGVISGIPFAVRELLRGKDRFLCFLGVLVDVHFSFQLLSFQLPALRLQHFSAFKLSLLFPFSRLPCARSSFVSERGSWTSDGGVEIAAVVGLADGRHAVPFQPEDLAALRRLRNLRAGPIR